MGEREQVARMRAAGEAAVQLEYDVRRWEARLSLYQAIPETDPEQIHDEESELRRVYRERYRMLSAKVRSAVIGDQILCPVCKVIRDLTVDHIVPPTLGGSDHDSNLWVLCRGCNTRKGMRTRAEWRALLIASAHERLATIRTELRALRSPRRKKAA